MFDRSYTLIISLKYWRFIGRIYYYNLFLHLSTIFAIGHKERTTRQHHFGNRHQGPVEDAWADRYSDKHIYGTAAV